MRISGNCLFVTETKVAGQYFNISCNVLAKFVLVYALPRAWRYFFLRFFFFLPPSFFPFPPSFSFSRPVFYIIIRCVHIRPFSASRFFRPSIPLRSSVLHGFSIRFHGISPLFFALFFLFVYLCVRFPLAGERCSCRRSARPSFRALRVPASVGVLFRVSRKKSRKTSEKIWRFRENALPLHRFSGIRGGAGSGRSPSVREAIIEEM